MSVVGTKSRWDEVVYHWLSAPLLLTVVGALLINFVIPQITTNSQNHQRALEVKTSLVSDMSDAIAKSLMVARLVATDVIPKTGASAQGPFNTGLQEWQEQQAKLGTELEAYFPGSRVSGEWRQYAETVTNVYFLSATGVEDRLPLVEKLQKRLRARKWCSGNPAIDWASIRSENQRTPRTALFHQSYIALNSCVLGRGDDLVHEVLGLTPSGF